MGVTIHFSGTLRSLGDLPAVERIGREHARRWGHDPVVVDDADGSELPFPSDEPFDPSGPVRGLILMPHPDCEPMLFYFDRNGHVNFHCKTQFAPAAIHIAIARFLEEVRPFFAGFEVYDDGGYWDTRDVAELLRRREVIANGIDMLAGLFEHGRPKGKPPEDHTLN